MDGLAASAAIRAREAQADSHIPIIAMTAHVMRGDRERFLGAGMDDCLAKPFTLHALRDTLLLWESKKSQPQGHTVMAGHHHGFDPGRIFQSLGQNPELIREVICVALRHIPERLERVRKALASQTIHVLTAEAHALKGVFLTIGAEPLAASCQQLMKCGERGETVQIGTEVNLIQEQWARLRQELESLLDSLGTTPLETSP